jgi:lipoprotein-releasing system permease protein
MQTLFIIVGIAIGVGVIVFMSAMLAGLEANFIKRVLTSQPQIQLLAPDQIARPLRNGPGEFEDATVQHPSQRVISIDQWPKIRDQMLAMAEVTAVSPTILGSVLAVRGDASRAVTLTGVEPDSYFKIVRVPDYIVAGDPRLTSEDIIIGIELAKDLGAAVGDKLNIQAASGANRILTIAGLVDLGNKGVNQRVSFVALRTAQSLLGMIGGVTTIDITVQDIYAAEEIARRIQAANAVEADSWIKTNAQFFTAVQAQKNTNTLIRLFVAMSVAFGIAAVLVVSVIQRSREIGILRLSAARRPAWLRWLAVWRGARSLRAYLLALRCPADRRIGAVSLDPGAPPFHPDRVAGDDNRIARRHGARRARRETRSGGGDPWLRKSCDLRRCASPTT